MKAKKILFTAVCFCMLSAINAQTPRFVSDLFDYLSHANYRPARDGNTVSFTFNRINHTIKVDWEDRLFFVRINNSGYPLIGEGSYNRNISIMVSNEVNRELQTVKLHCTEHNVVFMVELYTRSFENFRDVLNEYLNDLATADGRFLELYKTEASKPATRLRAGNVAPFNNGGGTQKISVDTDAASYQVTNVPNWCKVEINSEHFTVTCDPNNGERRTASLKITANNLETTLPIEQQAATTTLQVSGIVTSSRDGQPLPGVKVVVKGTTTGTITNVNGHYSVNIPAANAASAILQFSFIGYNTQEITVAGRQTINLSIEEVKRTNNARFGLKAGLNFANINNQEEVVIFTPEMKTGLHVGAFLDFPVVRRTMGSLEVMFSQQGFKYDSNAINFNYLNVGMILKIGLTQGLNLELGPWVSFLMSVNPDTMITEEYEINLSNLQGGKDVGIATGLSYCFSSGLMLGARYNFGLSEMANNLQWTNRIFAISIGYRF